MGIDDSDPPQEAGLVDGKHARQWNPDRRLPQGSCGRALAAVRYLGPVSRDRAEAGERSRPGPGREGRAPHSRRRDRQRERVDIRARAEGALRDMGTYRVVALRDLVDGRFGGNRFAAVAALRKLERAGLVRIAEASGPRGGKFKVLGLTEQGRQKLAGSDGGQRYWTGQLDGRQVPHDVAVYRAADREREKIVAEGGRVTRVRIDSEFRSIVARRVEKARAEGGAAAAEAEAARIAEELGLSREGGKFHYPDARIEYVDAQGRTGGVDVEVTTAHYRGATVRGKAAAGFAIHAAGRAAARAAGLGLPRLGGGGSGSGSGGGGGAGREDEGLLEL